MSEKILIEFDSKKYVYKITRQLTGMDAIVDSLIREVSKKYDLFVRKFHAKPTFVKIPDWAMDFLSAIGVEYFGKPVKGLDFLCGLKPCPTISIDKIQEIEVF